MASTYKSNLYSVEEIGIGEADGIWGTLTNDNWEVIQRAIGYSVELDVDNISGSTSYSNPELNWIIPDDTNVASLNDDAKARSSCVTVKGTGGSPLVINFRICGLDTTTSVDRIYFVRNALTDTSEPRTILRVYNADGTEYVDINQGSTGIVSLTSDVAGAGKIVNLTSQIQVGKIDFSATSSAEILLENDSSTALQIKQIQDDFTSRIVASISTSTGLQPTGTVANVGGELTNGEFDAVLSGGSPSSALDTTQISFTVSGNELSAINVLAPGVGWTAPPVLSFEKAIGVFSLGVSTTGSGYVTDGTYPVVFSVGGEVVPATATFVVTAGAVSGVNLTSSGQYTGTPTATFNDGLADPGTTFGTGNVVVSTPPTGTVELGPSSAIDLSESFSQLGATELSGSLLGRVRASTGPFVSATPITLANIASPLVSGGNLFITGGTADITNFSGGTIGQTITIISAFATSIKEGSILLDASTNYNMGINDSLTVALRSDNKWHETARMSRTGSTGNSLSSLSDVTLVAPIENEQVLAYDSGTTLWTNSEIVIPPGSPQGPNDGNLAPTNTSLGVLAMNESDGVDNTAIGNEAGISTIRDHNTFLGADAGKQNNFNGFPLWQPGTVYSIGDEVRDLQTPQNVWKAQSSGTSGSTALVGTNYNEQGPAGLPTYSDWESGFDYVDVGPNADFYPLVIGAGGDIYYTIPANNSGLSGSTIPSVFDTSAGTSDGNIIWYPRAFKWKPNTSYNISALGVAYVGMFWNESDGSWWNDGTSPDNVFTTGTVAPNAPSYPTPLAPWWSPTEYGSEPTFSNAANGGTGAVTFEWQDNRRDYVPPFDDGGVTWYVSALGWQANRGYGGYMMPGRLLADTDTKGGSIWSGNPDVAGGGEGGGGGEP